ncbi:hypothetical protein HY479_03265 [Candidatus Uhrbacteria bacterium]|nr:hypothetical protein [Candidatus Uhrbacteria bacterium]
MDTEFFGLSLTREELAEVQAALVQRAMLEDELRREKGLEPVADRPLLRRIDAILRPSDARLDHLTQALDDELWEFAWYAFTEEWAWFRARQEIRKELGSRASKLEEEEMRRRVEQRFNKYFEKFVKELEMADAPLPKTNKQRRTA